MHKPKRLPVVREDLFWEKVDVRGPDDCWLWTGALSRDGYGSFRANRVTTRAHRIAWRITQGNIPPGEGWHGTCVLHRCDVRHCVNPRHLFLGTPKDNAADRDGKGRARWVVHRGEKHGHAKLTANDIRNIRKLWNAGGITITELRRRYDVDWGTIHDAVHRITWKCVDDSYDLV